MKKFICAVLAVIVLSACALSGCAFMRGGADGIDGQDLNIYDIYEATNAEREKRGEEQLDFLEFLREYLNYEFEYVEDDLQSQINRSLLSSVALYTGFHYLGRQDEYYAGSGVIVDIDKSAGDAYILTNCHVVLDTGANPKTPFEILVFLYGNDNAYDITNTSYIPLSGDNIVAYSVSYDLALLRVTNSDIIKNSDARAAVFAESEIVYAGEKVYTVGNPAGNGISVTTGIISKDSEFIAVDFAEGTVAENNYRVMRTDAGTNSGNSGGALYDSSGRVLGIINAKDPYSENENMGYALCGSYVKRIWKLMRDGYTANGKSGIRCAVFPGSYSYSSKAYFNSQTNLTEIVDTVTVTLVNATSGLRMGDIIKHIKIVKGSGENAEYVEDMDITRFYNVDDALISAREGYKVIYTVRRGEETLDVECSPTFKNIV